jgi:hypothetical protein
LPAYVGTRLGGELEETVARLVLDGVLEVERDGGFVSGPAAVEPRRRRGDHPAGGRTAQLSHDALCYAQALEDLPAEALAARLYAYGRQPVSERLRSRLGTREARELYLGLDRGGPSRRLLEARFVQVSDGDSESPWLLWRARSNGSRPRNGAAGRAKLYVSPSIDALPEVLSATIESVAAARGAAALKLGASVADLCRPDKLMVYFAGLDDLHKAASALSERLDGAGAQGVPFTAAITADGLLSWGLDPPEQVGAGSWRLWVTTLLARYLAVARELQSGSSEPWLYATERLRLDGVDPVTWTPEPALWSDSALAS